MKRTHLIAGLLLGLLGAGIARSGTIRHDRLDALYLALADQPRYASVGQICTSSQLGSGVLIAPDWVVTAGHLAAGQMTFRLGEATFSCVADSFVAHPEQDVGLFRLEQPVPDVAPAALYPPELGSELGLEATAVGYGRSGTGLTGEATSSGTKRAGTNKIDLFGSYWGWSEDVILTDFDHVDGSTRVMGSTEPLDLEYCAAHGDSGGGLFVDVQGETYLAGVQVTLWQFDKTRDADYGDGNKFVRVASLYDWINDVVTPSDPPVVVDDAYAIYANVALNVASPGVLGNDEGDIDVLSVLVQADPQHGTLALGPDGGFTYMPEVDFLGTDVFTYGLYDGEDWVGTPGTVTIHVQQPPPGDANADGCVNAEDAAVLAAHWLSSTTRHWSEGDFNDDGRVDEIDASILAAHWGTEAPPTSVPEPACWILLLAGAAAMLIRTRRADIPRARCPCHPGDEHVRPESTSPVVR